MARLSGVPFSDSYHHAATRTEGGGGVSVLLVFREWYDARC
jgi:hypothetical protein